MSKKLTPKMMEAADFLKALVHGWSTAGPDGAAIVDGPYLVKPPEGWNPSSQLLILIDPRRV